LELVQRIVDYFNASLSYVGYIG